MAELTVRIEFLKHVTIGAQCPQCGVFTGTDCGTCMISDLKPEMELWCNEHGTFKLPIDWGAELNKLIAKKRSGS